MSKSNSWLTIKEFSEIVRMSPRMLRFWEKKGIFKPEKVDASSNYRYYKQEQAKDVLNIRLLTNFHIPLKNIKEALRLHKPEAFLQERLALLKQEIEEKQKEQNFLQQIHKFFFDQDYLKSNVKTENIGPFILFCNQINNGQYHKINEYIENLWQIAIKLKLKCELSEMTFYLDESDTYSPRDAKLEVALICKFNKIPVIDLPKGFYFKEYPKTQMLTYYYKGPYDYMALIDQRLRVYFNQTGAHLKGKDLEKYIKGSYNTKSKYDYLTILGYPI